MTAIARDRNIASVSPIPVLILLHGNADHVPLPGQDSEKLYALARFQNKNLLHS